MKYLLGVQLKKIIANEFLKSQYTIEDRSFYKSLHLHINAEDILLMNNNIQLDIGTPYTDIINLII